MQKITRACPLATCQQVVSPTATGHVPSSGGAAEDAEPPSPTPTVVAAAEASDAKKQQDDGGMAQMVTYPSDLQRTKPTVALLTW